MFCSDEGTDIPQCETRADGAGDEEFSPAGSVDEEDEGEDRGDCLHCSVHSY